MNRWFVSCGLALLVLTSSMAIKTAMAGTSVLPVPPPTGGLVLPVPPPTGGGDVLPVPPPTGGGDVLPVPPPTGGLR